MLRFDIDANISSLNSITKALLVFALVPSLHIGGVVFATLMADTLSNLLKLYYCKKLYQPLRFRIAYVTYDELARLFHFSKHVAAIGVARTLNTKSAPFIIAKVLDLGAVAIFSIADRLVNHAQSFAYSVAETFGPVFTRKVARHENRQACS